MVAKKYQNPEGGLNAAGRAYFKRTEGSNLKAPVKGAPKSREALGRKASFLARMAGVKGPDFDEKGKPTRKGYPQKQAIAMAMSSAGKSKPSGKSMPSKGK